MQSGAKQTENPPMLLAHSSKHPALTRARSSSEMDDAWRVSLAALSCSDLMSSMCSSSFSRLFVTRSNTSAGIHHMIEALAGGGAELLCKVRLSTSSWHLAYGVARQKSNMDAPAGCKKDDRKVLRHLTCSTCCCCGSSADEVKGHMQGHRGRACSHVTNRNAVKCRGCGLL